MELTDLHRLAIALGLGFLVGLQREWAAKRVAGVRTFPLITVLGALCAMLAGRFGGWEVAAGFVALAAIVVLGQRAWAGGEEDGHRGVTTEAAALVMFAVGAILMAGETAVAVAMAGAVAVLLHWKAPLHRLVREASEAEARAVMRLVVIGLVILPLLPDRSYGPYGVFNPFEIWLMVVLIVGISLAAYVAYQLLGAATGTLVAGVFGGLISSTATTVSYARRTRGEPRLAAVAAVVIMIASTIVFGRVLFEVAVVAPELLWSTAPPLLVMAGWMAVVSAAAFVVFERRGGELPEQQPPSNLLAAIVFGLLYAGVLFGVAVAREHFGEAGLYVVAALSGLTDMDAITLSSAQMMKSGRIELAEGWRLILIGTLANILFKGVVAGLLGTGRLAGYLALVFGLSVLGGLAILRCGCPTSRRVPRSGRRRGFRRLRSGRRR